MEMPGVARKLFSRRPQPYYIYAPDYRRTSAGVRVMHMLCDALIRSGHEAYVTAKVVNPELMTPRLTKSTVALHHAQGMWPIAVYPEIVDGNPLYCLTVARYLLNWPGFLRGKGEYAEDDLLFAYTRGLLQPGMPEDQLLFLPAIDTRVFCPPDDPARRIAGKVCYYQGRRGQATIDLALLPEDAVEITSQWPASWEALADLFQQCEYFYCGEASGLAAEAALCGCIGVVIPSEWAPRNFGSFETQNYGMAWGTDPAELERARQTLPLLRESLLRHQEGFWPALDHFIEITQVAAFRRAAEHPCREKSVHPDSVRGIQRRVRACWARWSSKIVSARK